jgi:hypothetical protein
MKPRPIKLLIVILALFATSLACGLLSGDAPDGPSIDLNNDSGSESQPTEATTQDDSGSADSGGLQPVDEGDSSSGDNTVEPTAVPIVSEPVLLRQWASSATASSAYDVEYWTAAMATGAPNVQTCRDSADAWASLSGDTVEWLEVSFDTPVTPTEINIHENFNPGQIVSVEIIDLDGVYHEIYGSSPEVASCPRILTISQDTFRVINKIRITVDQSVLDIPWNEIDAVELVGFTADGQVAQSDGGGGSDDSGSADNGAGGDGGGFDDVGSSEFPPPANYLGQGGYSPSDPDHPLQSPGRIAVQNHPTLGEIIVVADPLTGLVIMDARGELINVISAQGFSPSDIATGENGEIYVAHPSTNEVIVMDPDGNEVSRFGEQGTGEGGFGISGPQQIADNGGTLYVFDVDPNADNPRELQYFFGGNEVFSAAIDDQTFSAQAMEFGPDQMLYILEDDGAIYQFNQSGDLITVMAEDTLAGTLPTDIAIDSNGFMYVTTWWGEHPIYIFDSSGNLVDNLGLRWDNTDAVPPPGYHYQPVGITVLADGSVIYVSEWGFDFGLVTAYSRPQ